MPCWPFRKKKTAYALKDDARLPDDGHDGPGKDAPNEEAEPRNSKENSEAAVRVSGLCFPSFSTFITFSNTCLSNIKSTLFSKILKLYHKIIQRFQWCYEAMI